MGGTALVVARDSCDERARAHDDQLGRVDKAGLPARACYGGAMLNMHNQAGTVLVDEVTYEWELRREPQWSDADGWRGMTIALLQTDTQREAVLEFPPPKRLLKGLQRGRLQINDAIVSRGIRAALAAGWEPTSRGKPVVFTVDADGN
ncbi:hypothetical protein YGS_C1P1337 [Sphingobium sp. YG1]|nr:hypothetical protein YGS_C1P1337 [Sphingobium sp. YG1]